MGLKILFESVNEDYKFTQYFSVVSCLIGGIFYLRHKINGYPTWLKKITVLSLFILHTIYIVFRFTSSLNLDTPPNVLVSIIFLWTDILLYLNSFFIYPQMAFRTERSKDADEVSQKVLSGQYSPWVDVFIPTYNEPSEILRRTIIGCQAMDYSNKRIYLLDDTNRPEIKQLAQDLECFYMSREDNKHKKAGNINNALLKTSGELIAFFDADHVPCRNFLIRLVGFFYDSKVGLVVSPQHFYNIEVSSRNLGLGDVIPSEQSIFFRNLQSGRDAFEALLCHGTCFIAKREALEKTGGIPFETAAEDWATSIAIQAAGYKSYYLNEILSAGIAPENIEEFVQQRLRFARGTIQGLFSQTNPLRIKGLSFWQRFIHFSGVANYLIFPLYFIYLTMPLFYLFFEWTPIKATTNEFMAFAIPFYMFNMMSFSWLCHRHTSKFYSILYSVVLCVPMMMNVLRTLVQPFWSGFRVTQKDTYQKRINFNKSVLKPIVVLFLLYCVGLIYRIYALPWTEDRRVFFTLCMWSLFNVGTLWLSLQLAIDIPQERRSYRFCHRLPCKLSNGVTTVEATIINLSDRGALLDFYSEKKFVDKLGIYHFSIPSLEIENVSSKILHNNLVNSISLNFTSLNIQQYRKLIEFLYCRSHQWKTIRIRERKAVLELIKSIFRVYPLAETR